MSNIHKKTNRRTFIQSAGIGIGLPFFIPSTVLGQSNRPAPSDRITIGCIGVGGRGTADMNAFIREPAAQVIAVCDVKKRIRDAAKQNVEQRYAEQTKQGTYKGCASYKDFRDLLAQKEIDAVSIATPDHWHVPIGIAAAKANKDMFIEKPLSHKLEEGRLLCRAVDQYKRIFQHGTQQRTGKQFRHACELVRNQKIGTLKTIQVGSPASGFLDDQPPMQVPPGFDYNQWLGIAPKKPYTEKRTITPWWWFISDYTIGFVAGWGVHHIDIAQWGNDSDDTGPVEMEGSGQFPQSGMCDTATAWEIEMKYANGVSLLYTDNQKCKQGVLFEGTEGWVHVNRQGIDAFPKSLLEYQFKPDEIRLYKAPNLQQNLLECIKSRKQTICPVETAHRSTSICHLSQITMLLNRKLEWNPVTEKFVGDKEANEMLKIDTSKPAFNYDYYSL